MFGIPKNFWRSRTKRLPTPSKPEPSLPLGLNRDQLEAIRELTGTIHFKHYSAALEALYENNLSAMLRALPHDAYLFQCGVCFALEQIAKLPDDLTLKLRELDARHTDNADAAPDSSTVFANSPFWDAYQRLNPSARQYRSTGVRVPEQRERPGIPPRQNGG